MLRLITWIALRLGRAPARALLYPICSYFLLLSPRARRASRTYLERVLKRRVGVRDVFRHYHCFGATILDRVFLLSGRSGLFAVEVHGAEIVRDRARRGQACILLGAHLGSFEVLRTFGATGAGLPIKILMYEDNARRVRAMARYLNPALAEEIIPIGGIDSLLQVKAQLDQRTHIGILGDRVQPHDRVVYCQFLGHTAAFPAGPMLLAASAGVPVVLCLGLYAGANRYSIHCELLAERIEFSRSRRLEDLQHWTQRYASRLEHYARLAPYNWFNFYDFWASREELV